MNRMDKESTDSFDRHPFGRMWLSVAVPSLLLFSLVIDYSSYNRINTFVYLLFAVGLVLPLLKFSWGFYYYLIVSVLSDDTPRLASLKETGEFASVHFTTLGPFAVMVYWTIYMGFLLFCYFLASPRSLKLTKLDKYMMGIVLLFAASGIIGAGNLLEFPRYYIVDSSYLLNTIIFYFFMRLAITGKNEMRRAVTLFLLCCGIKAILGMLYYFQGLGTPAGAGNFRVLHGSTHPLLASGFFLCLSLILYIREMRVGYKALLGVFAFTSFFHLATFGSRGSVVMAVLGLALFLVLSRRMAVSWLLTKYVVLTALVAVSCLFLIAKVSPGTYIFVGWKLETLLQYDPDLVDRYGSYSTVSRIAEATNILGKEWDDKSILWGKGMGGWFDDRYYPFPYELLGGATFTEDQVRMGKYFKPHGTPLLLLLKMGVGGMLTYYVLMFLFLKEAYGALRKIEGRYWRAVGMALLVTMPFFLYKNFMSKPQVFFGVMLGILANIHLLVSVKALRVGQRPENDRNGSHLVPLSKGAHESLHDRRLLPSHEGRGG